MTVPEPTTDPAQTGRHLRPVPTAGSPGPGSDAPVERDEPAPGAGGYRQGYSPEVQHKQAAGSPDAESPEPASYAPDERGEPAAGSPAPGSPAPGSNGTAPEGAGRKDRGHRLRQADTGTGRSPAGSAALWEAERRAAAEVARARAELPALDTAALDCFLGRLVGVVAEHTEADPVAVLASLLCAAGVYLGPGPHVRAGDDRHPLLVWPLIVGRTNSGRKGASWSSARRLLAAADPEFLVGNVRSGLTSGEGLAQLFVPVCQQCGTDLDSPSEEFCSSTCQNRWEKKGRANAARRRRLPPGDRRLLVFEPEWAAVMARMKREGNSLSATLRAAWEGGDLSTMNVTARVAPESHIGITAHITPAEFKAKVSAADLAGGTYNRFLPLLVARSKFLPLALGADPDTVAQLGASLAGRLRHAAGIGTLGFTAGGADAWRHLYVEFGTDPGEGTGPAVEQFISRTAPNCLRIAGIHAALDGSDQISDRHLSAAAALIRYSIASARAVFAPDAELTKIAGYIARAGQAGRTRTDITTECFDKHKKAAEIDGLLERLLAAGRITRSLRPSPSGRGRPTQIFTATSHANEAN
ncbi:hypothetical protein GCM10012275_60340 [Longimycelium tulufanense]|uniref:DUF3987 domain-containing protein n=1 Tax=Longimycelium tulufanense TaxID=907463 RepID=A0A8J3CE66_9PSEU|nr:DUF3987 domain-containing protein [Longimycelium tulufanense]GGM81637.1 hypothetical protein GCM10012275_60340 [Longimycelium tulufanense]